MEAVDRVLLLATGRDRPRVVVLPTASWPDGEETFHRLGRAGRGALRRARRGGGARPRPRSRRTRTTRPPPPRSARRTSSTCPAGSPATCSMRSATAAWAMALRAAHARGAVIAGCSAGAMVLAGHQLRSAGRCLRAVPDRLARRAGDRARDHRDPALRRVPGAAVGRDGACGARRLPRARDRRGAPRWSDGMAPGRSTAVGRVTVWRGRHRERLRAGDTLRLPVAEANAPEVAPGRGASDGLDLAEAVRAIDRLIHARLERDLGIVAAARAGHREELPV